ncbi:MAG: hypothetical protein AB7O73_01300 [Bacteroidia bacterium]
MFSSFMTNDHRVIIEKKHDFFEIDNLGNFILVNQNELLKYKPDGTYFNRYSNLKLGPIFSLDATNGLRLLVYYKDFQQIVFLDSQLSSNSSPVSLENLGLEQAALVCSSANNGIWVYNAANNELIRFSDNLKEMIKSGNLKQILREDISPDFMVESNGFVYLNVPDKGIYVFDIFGAFIKVISLKNLSSISIQENLIYSLKGGKFCSYDFKLFEEKCDSLGGEDAKDAAFFKGQIFWSSGNQIIN